MATNASLNFSDILVVEKEFPVGSNIRECLRLEWSHSNTMRLDAGFDIFPQRLELAWRD